MSYFAHDNRICFVEDERIRTVIAESGGIVNNELKLLHLHGSSTLVPSKRRHLSKKKDQVNLLWSMENFVLLGNALGKMLAVDKCTLNFT